MSIQLSSKPEIFSWWFWQLKPSFPRFARSQPILTLAADLTADCGLVSQSHVTPFPPENAEKSNYSPCRLGKVYITFKLYNSLYTHHFYSSGRKVPRSTPIISRGKSFRNYKVLPTNLLYFYVFLKKKWPWTEECSWGSCPVICNAIFPK